MDAILAEIDKALKIKGLSAAAASKQASGHYSLIKNMKASKADGKRYSVDTLEKLAEVLDLELYFGPRRGPATIERVQLDSTDFASIPVHQAMLAAGGGRINDTEDRVGYLAFRRDWLRQIGVSVADAVLARAEGDSMLPGIRDKDLLLIDRARSELPTKLRAAKDTRPAPIYAVLVDGEARVKRIERAPGNTLALLSDNPAYPPDFRPLGAVTPIGQVMWWAHTNHE